LHKYELIATKFGTHKLCRKRHPADHKCAIGAGAEPLYYVI